MTPWVIESEISSPNSATIRLHQTFERSQFFFQLVKARGALVLQDGLHMAAILFAPVTGCSERTSDLQASSPFLFAHIHHELQRWSSQDLCQQARCASKSPECVIGCVNGSARSIAVGIGGATTPTYALRISTIGSRSPPTVCHPSTRAVPGSVVIPTDHQLPNCARTGNRDQIVSSTTMCKDVD